MKWLDVDDELGWSDVGDFPERQRDPPGPRELGDGLSSLVEDLTEWQ